MTNNDESGVSIVSDGGIASYVTPDVLPTIALFPALSSPEIEIVYIVPSVKTGPSSWKIFSCNPFWRRSRFISIICGDNGSNDPPDWINEILPWWSASLKLYVIAGVGTYVLGCGSERVIVGAVKSYRIFSIFATLDLFSARSLPNIEIV